MRYRPARPDDAAALAAIHAPYAAETAVTFQVEPSTESMFRHKIQEISPRYPFLVCEEEGRITGFAYAAAFRTKEAYQWDVELTVYLARDCQGKGVGSGLYQRLLTLLHMGTSIYNVETREGADGRAYIMEVSPRGGGNRLAEMLRYATGVDLVTNAVRAAVGLPTEGVEQKPYDGCWAEIILHSDTAGVFDRLWIAEEIRSNIVEEDLWITPGTKVGGFSAANEAVGTLVLKFETEEHLQRVMNDVPRYVKVQLK